jgi:hypothetical protein
MKDAVTVLLDECTAARGRGLDFPTIWHELLKLHPLVAGIPSSIASAAGPILRIPLRTGQYLLFDLIGFTLR